MNTARHRFVRAAFLSSVFICVHLWLNSLCFGQTFEKRWLSGIFYGEGANFGDFNKDGKLDVVSGPYIYDGPDFSLKREFMPREPSDPLAYSKNFFAYASDFNKDGYQDILIIGFPGAETYWYENPGAGGDTKVSDENKPRHWKQHLALKVTDNESPMLANLVGDDAPELVCMSGGYIGYAVPAPSEPGKPWAFIPISPRGDYQRFTHGLGVGDVNGDGKMDLLERTGWWEQPSSLSGDPSPVWKKHDESFAPAKSPGGAQMFAYDVDGDGDNDVITALHAHGYGLAWFEQAPPAGDGDTPPGQGRFKRHIILSPRPDERIQDVQFSQLHAVDLADIDNDGLKDIVTGKRYWAHGPTGDPDPEADPVLYFFKLTRKDGKASFEPRLIDNKSGVGTQVSTADANGDSRPDIVVGNKRGTMLFLSK